MGGVDLGQRQIGVVEHRTDYNPRLMEIIGSEQYPKYVYEKECDEHAAPIRHTVSMFVPYAVNDDTESVANAPYDEGPSCAMPEPTDEEHQKDVEQHLWFAAPAAPEGYIDILGEKAVQCHVPASPEILKRGGSVGRVEVEREVYVEHASDAYGHVTVSAEIKIQLQGKCNCPQPCRSHRCLPRFQQADFLP